MLVEKICLDVLVMPGVPVSPVLPLPCAGCLPYCGEWASDSARGKDCQCQGKIRAGGWGANDQFGSAQGRDFSCNGSCKKGQAAMLLEACQEAAEQRDG